MADTTFPLIGFERWINTPRGKRCASTKGITGEYMRNRLFWAFDAGLKAKDVQMTSEVQQILEAISKLPKGRIPVWIKNRLEYILANKEDYSFMTTNMGKITNTSK